MKAVLSGGGTAGHINPALALAEELSDRGWECLFVGTPNGVESRLVPDAGLEFKGIPVYGFDRTNPLSLVKALGAASRGTRTAKKWLQEVKPDVVVGFGGYVSIPVARAARSLGIPLVIHEQNSVMGMANKYASKSAAAICLTYDNEDVTEQMKPKLHITGNPVRKNVLTGTRAEGRKYLGIPQDAKMLLVFGGSLGARHINQAICAMKDELLVRGNLYIVHIAGPKELESVQETLALTDEQASRYIVKGYEDNMPQVLAAADAIVSRAGATSIAEISSIKIPAILVPYPYATADHQTTNAKSYAESGAAFSIPDKDLDTDEFHDLVLRIIDNDDLRAEMRCASAKRETTQASKALADVVEDVVNS